VRAQLEKVKPKLARIDIQCCVRLSAKYLFLANFFFAMKILILYFRFQKKKWSNDWFLNNAKEAELEIDEDLYPLKFKCISANREN
jgi:hypothetical protein